MKQRIASLLLKQCIGRLCETEREKKRERVREREEERERVREREEERERVREREKES